MQKFESVDQALDWAIEREEEAARFYTDLAAKMEHAEVQQVFQEFAFEELGHKMRLLGIRQGRLLMPEAKKVQNLKLADYLVDVPAQSDLTYKEALILAMKREKASFHLYSDLAATTENPTLRSTFLTLASEEARHKLRFELEYDREFLTEN